MALHRLVLNKLDAAKERVRKPQKRHRLNFERRIECILASVLRARFYRTSNRLAYRRGQNDYLVRNRCLEEGWLSAASLRSDIDLMEQVGLIATEKGVWGGSSSTFWSIGPLNELMAACGVNKHSIGKPLPFWQLLIQMRSEKDLEGGRRELSVEWDDETVGWAASLEAYNQFADVHDIWINGLSDKEERRQLAYLNEKRAEFTKEPGYIRLELFDRHLRRVFNDGTFAHGGRLYGAWYEQLPRWLRQRITINDEPTVELDYSGMSVRMLYHQKGIDYRDDPYSIPEVEAYAARQGKAKDHYRESIKQLIQALLNGDDDYSPEMIRLDQSFRPKFTRAQVRDMIFAKHGELRDHFGSGVGKALQRLDSDIALDVISRLQEEEGILSLPVHDSFRVIDVHKGRLHQQMVSSYRERLGFDPLIKED